MIAFEWKPGLSSAKAKVLPEPLTHLLLDKRRQMCGLLDENNMVSVGICVYIIIIFIIIFV